MITKRVIFACIALGLLGATSCDDSGDAHHHHHHHQSGHDDSHHANHHSVDDDEFNCLNATVCPLPEDTEGNRTRYDTINNKLMKCLFKSNNVDMKKVMSETNNTAGIREAMKRYCAETSTTSHCSVVPIHLAELCVNSTDQQIVKLGAGYFALLREVGCENEGTRFVAMLEVIKRHVDDNTTSSLNYLRTCFGKGGKQFRAGDARSDPVAYCKANYMFFHSTEECVKTESEASPELNHAVESIIDEFMAKAMCLDSHGDMQLCKNLYASEIATH